MTKEEEIKKEWYELTCKILGGTQDPFKEKLKEYTDMESIEKNLKDDADYWINEGRKWDHDFYSQVGYATRALYKKYFL